MRRLRYLPCIVVAILILFATMGCDPEEPELVATAVPTDNPTFTTDLSASTPTTTANAYSNTIAGAYSLTEDIPRVGGQSA